jgi:hypothetical protein
LFLNGFLEFLNIGSLREFDFEGFGMGGSEVDFNGFWIFQRSGFVGVLNVLEEVFGGFDGPVLQAVLILGIV